VGIARSFTVRVAAALLSLVATGMALGGLAVAGLGLTLRQANADVQSLALITTGLIAAGVALAIPGGVAVIWSRVAGYADAPMAAPRGGSIAAVLAAAVLIPAALATQLGPLAAYWRDVLALASEHDVWRSANGPSALVFMPAMGVLLVPALEAMTALTLALSNGVLLALIAVRSTAAIRHAAIGAVLVGGLVGASGIGVVTTERLAPAVESLIRDTADAGGQEQARALDMLARHRAVGVESAWTLTWAWGAMALLALAARTVLQRSADNLPDTLAAVLPLNGLDETTRSQALLDAADQLHRTTPPVRRF
jgi:hypothetical protein